MQENHISGSKNNINGFKVSQENSQQKLHSPTHNHKVVINTLIRERKLPSLTSKRIRELSQNNRNKRRSLSILKSLSSITNGSFTNRRDLVYLALWPVKSFLSNTTTRTIALQKAQSQILVNVLYKQPV